MADPEAIVKNAADLLDRRGVVATCYIAMVLLTQARYSAPAWHSWEHPDFIFGVFVLGLGASHGSYEALLWVFQTFVSDRVAGSVMQKKVVPRGSSKEKAKPSDNIDGDDLREFREWLLKKKTLRAQGVVLRHMKTHAGTVRIFSQVP